MNLIIDRSLKETLKPEISSLNKSLEEVARGADSFLGDLLSYVLINSGKRVRPALVYLSAQLGESNHDDIRAVEVAVELIHIATLIHDDVIDKAALRRGRKTVVNENGVDTAVLLGDHVYTFAFQKAAELGRPQILKLLAEATSLMCEGEINQLKKRYKFDLSEAEYFDFIHKKTAVLFGASARAGAILAEQEESIQNALQSYGVHLGMAFQITDDLLDLTGSEAVVGKTLRTDLTNGKLTLPLIHYRDRFLNGTWAQQNMETLQNPNGHLSKLIEDMKEAGSLEYARQVADEHLTQALQDLDALPPGKWRDQFTALAEMLKDRKA